MEDSPTVFVVDDDEHARQSVCALVNSMSLPAESFASGEKFLERYQEDRLGCLITDLRMPGMSGLDLQEQLLQRQSPLPVIILTAYARTPSTVRAIRAGALTVMDKPCVEDDLCDVIRLAIVKDAVQRREHARIRAVRARFAKLTPLERRVLDLVVCGQPNKAIAKELEISIRTVASRRAEIVAKLGVASTIELIRLIVQHESGS